MADGGLAGSDFGDEGLAEREDDVAVLVGILEDWVAVIAGEIPAGSGDDFVVAVEGLVAGNEVESVGGGLALTLDPSLIRRERGWCGDLDGNGGAEAGAAVGEGNQGS